MGLFDDLLGKVTDLTGGLGDAASNIQEDVTAQAGEKITEVTDQIPQNPTDVVGDLFGGSEEK